MLVMTSLTSQKINPYETKAGHGLYEQILRCDEELARQLIFSWMCPQWSSVKPEKGERKNPLIYAVNNSNLLKMVLNRFSVDIDAKEINEAFSKAQVDKNLGALEVILEHFNTKMGIDLSALFQAAKDENVEALNAELNKPNVLAAANLYHVIVFAKVHISTENSYIINKVRDIPALAALQSITSIPVIVVTPPPSAAYTPQYIGSSSSLYASTVNVDITSETGKKSRLC